MSNILASYQHTKKSRKKNETAVKQTITD